MVTVTEQHRARSARGEDRRFTPPLRPSAASVVDSFVPLCRCGKNQFLFVDSCSSLIERSADALGRPLGEFESGTFPGEASTIQTQHTLVYDANTGNVIQEINQIDGTDPVRYVYGPNGNVIMQQSGTNGSTGIDQTLYALQGADGSTVAITDGTGNVVERYVYDGLGNAQALDSSGNPYPVSTTGGDANWQFQEQFSGSTFDASTQLLTAEGTQYAWNILYHGQMYDGIPGVYETPQGAFNPGIQSLLAPERGVVQVAGNPYTPGSVTMPTWIERIEGGFQTVGGVFESLVGAGTSAFGVGIPVAANGVDNFPAGLRELWTGQYVQTYTSQAIQWGAEEVGTSPSTAYNIGEVGNGVIGFAGMLGAGLINDASQGSWLLNAATAAQRFAAAVGEVGPRAISLNVLNPEFVPDTVTVNRATAFNFLTTYGGRDEAEAVLHMRGIDFNRPVSVVTIAPKTVLQQFVKWGRTGGSYFSPLGTNLLEAGIGDAVTRDLVLYSNSEPVKALQSTASDFLYPDEVIVPWTGGGIQFYAPNKGAFKPI